MALLDVRVELERAHGPAASALFRFATDSRHSALHGPSAAGKTTLLRIIAGLERQSSRGRVSFRDQVWQDNERGIFVPPHLRGIGWVPQEALLFPHLSVRANLAFPAKFKPGALESVVELLELGSLLGRSPNLLSGGERQRVALGRALMAAPDLLLLDEAFSALHRGFKARLLPRLAGHCAELGIIVLMVTHQSDDAVAFGCSGVEWEAFTSMRFEPRVSRESPERYESSRGFPQ